MREVLDIAADLRRECGRITAPHPYAALMSEAAERMELFARTFNEDTVLTLASQILGMTPDRLRELAQAEKDGRLVVLPDVKYTDSDGDKALRHAMYMCGVQNNPVTRYTADAIAEKLTREAAEAARKDLEADHERDI